MTDGRPRRSYVDAPHGQIHVAEAGSGTPLILIHQTPRSSDEFREVMGLLSSQVRTVAFDLPGMGASDPLPAPPSIEEYAAAALHVADALGLDSFHICGHHTGGVVAVEVAAHAPDRVRSIALSSTPWIDGSARRARASAPPPVDVATHRPDGGHLIDLWNQRRPYYPMGHELLDRYLADALRASSTEEGHRAVGRYAMDERCRSVRCPVLVIEHAGDPFASKHTDALVAGFRPVSVVLVEDGRIPLEHGAVAVARALADFVGR
ncbi:MAG: alpha/beta hydrolase [Ilumatobacter sp.]|nr:alpha/beta hydrolase [Ilumatobacter sp.]